MVRRAERGALEVQVPVVLLALSGLALLILGMVGALALRERVQGIAELSALAAAATADCDAARTVAERNGARLLDCRSDAAVMAVRIALLLQRPEAPVAAVLPDRVEATARAAAR